MHTDRQIAEQTLSDYLERKARKGMAVHIRYLRELKYQNDSNSWTAGLLINGVRTHATMVYTPKIRWHQDYASLPVGSNKFQYVEQLVAELRAHGYQVKLAKPTNFGRAVLLINGVSVKLWTRWEFGSALRLGSGHANWVAS